MGIYSATRSSRTSIGPSSTRWKKRAHTSSSWPISVRLRKNSPSESPARARRSPTPCAYSSSPPTVQKKVAAQVITAGHARALLSLETAEDMERLAERIVAEGLSVRTTEEIVRLGKAKATPRPRARQQRPLSQLGGDRRVGPVQCVRHTCVHHGGA